jgi:hypothetical protein
MNSLVFTLETSVGNRTLLGVTGKKGPNLNLCWLVGIKYGLTIPQKVANVHLIRRWAG